MLDPRTLGSIPVARIREEASRGGNLSDAVLRAMETDRRAAVRKIAGQIRTASTQPRRALLAYDEEFRKNGVVHLAGVDEAGRGPLAGPVFAAAVILPANTGIEGANDSKKLSAAQRELVEPEIWRVATAAHVASVDVFEIDRINILQASLKAMRMAVAGLSVPPDRILVDGKFVAGSPFPETAIVDGDSLSLSIAAASILAKVARDRVMVEMDGRFPGYGFAKHKGYGTKQHLEALRRLGPCPIHRRSFIGASGAPDQNEHDSHVADLRRGIQLCQSPEELSAVAEIISEKKASLSAGEITFLRRVYRRQREILNRGSTA